MVKSPELIVVPPVKTLAEESVSEPLPVFMRAIVPPSVAAPPIVKDFVESNLREPGVTASTRLIEVAFVPSSMAVARPFWKIAMEPVFNQFGDVMSQLPLVVPRQRATISTGVQFNKMDVPEPVSENVPKLAGTLPSKSFVELPRVKIPERLAPVSTFHDRADDQKGCEKSTALPGVLKTRSRAAPPATVTAPALIESKLPTVVLFDAIDQETREDDP